MFDALMPADWLQNYSSKLTVKKNEKILKYSNKTLKYSYTIQTLNTFENRNVMRLKKRWVEGNKSLKWFAAA